MMYRRDSYNQSSMLAAFVHQFLNYMKEKSAYIIHKIIKIAKYFVISRSFAFLFSISNDGG